MGEHLGQNGNLLLRQFADVLRQASQASARVARRELRDTLV